MTKNNRYQTDSLATPTHIYTLDAYQAAFAVMIGWSILAAVVMFFATESYCRQMVENCS